MPSRYTYIRTFIICSYTLVIGINITRSRFKLGVDLRRNLTSVCVKYFIHICTWWFVYKMVDLGVGSSS